MEAKEAMDHQQEQGDAVLGVEAYVFEFYGELPKEERDKRIRQMNHLLKKGAVPGRKVGKFWLGSRRRIRQFISGEA
jgi:hypothetical protein